MGENIKKAGRDRAHRATGGLLDLQPTRQLSEQAQAQARPRENDDSTSTRTSLSSTTTAQAGNDRNRRESRRQPQPPNNHDPSDSEGDQGSLTDDDEEEVEDEDGAYYDPCDDNESSYVEEGGSDRQDDESKSHHDEDDINNDTGASHGQPDDDDYKTFSVDDVTHRLQIAATDDECIRLIEKIVAIKTIPGLSNYMSALKENWRVANILAPAVVSCIAGSRIQNEASTRMKMVTLEDLISLLPYKFCAQPPTLKIMELHIERQILRGYIRSDLQTVVLLPHHLLDHCEEPDILEHIRFRLRLPDAPSPDDADDGVDVPSLVEATPSRIIITLFREDSTSHTVLAVTTLRHDFCSTLFIFYHFVSKQKREALVSKLTSVFNRILKRSGICIRSVTASFPKPGNPKIASSRPIEDEVEISAFCACRLALAIIKEAQLRETPSPQGTASGGQTKKAPTILGRLAALRSAECSRDGSNFIIPKDFIAGDLLSPSWMKPSYLRYYTSLPIANGIREALLSENFLRTKSFVWGRKLGLIDTEGREEINEGDEDLEEGDMDRERDEIFAGQEQTLGGTDALLAEFLIDQAEDTDDEYDSDTELLVSPSTEALVDQDTEDTVDTAYVGSADSPGHWTRYVFRGLSDDEIDVRVTKLLTPDQIKENRLTQEDVDRCLRSIGPEIHPVLPSETCKQNILRYQDMHRELIRRTAMIPLAFSNGHEFARATGMTIQSWQFNVANSTREAQECLFRLFTDPRTRPLDVQALLGSPVWRRDMWNLLPTINVDEPQSAEQKWSVYIIKLENIHGDSVEGEQDLDPGHGLQVSQPDQGIYVGSAQGQQSGSSSLAGEISRLLSGHEPLFQMSPDDLSELRKGSARPRALYIHEVGTRVGVRRTYYSTASFPVIRSPSWFQARIKQSIQRLENDQVIILASLGMYEPKGPRARYIWASQVYVENVRPSSWPRPPWTGLNKVLPSTQSQTLLSQGASIAIPGLSNALRQFHEKTGKIHLDLSDIRSILGENRGFVSSNGHILPEKIRSTVRICYGKVLRENGLAYENRSGQALRLIFPILWGLAQHFIESGLILGERDSEYVLYWTAVDWCRVAQLAQKIAPEGEKKTYSPAFCSRKGTTGQYDAIFRRLFPFKPNFDAISGLSELPALFRKTNRPPFPYLIRAREVMWIYSMQFLDSRVNFDTVNGVEIVTLPAPTTKGGIRKLLKELRDHVLQTSRTQIACDLRFQSKDTLGPWSETELSRLGAALVSATQKILMRILVDEGGVRLVDRMVSPGSRAQNSEDLGSEIYPILATRWRKNLRNGIQPYRENINADVCDNADADFKVMSNMNRSVVSPFEHPPYAEQHGDLDVVESIEEDILALRKYRSWVTGEAERSQATWKPGEALRRPESFALLAKGGHPLKETKRRSDRENNKTRRQTRATRSAKTRPAEDDKRRSDRLRKQAIATTSANRVTKISPAKDVKRRNERVRTQTRASASANRARKELLAGFVDNLDTSERGPEQASVFLDTGGTQTIDEFIRDAVSRKESKSRGFKGDVLQDEQFFLALSRWKQKKSGFCSTYDWGSEELQLFAETYSEKDQSGGSLAAVRVKQYFQGAARRKAGRESEEYERVQVKALAAGLMSSLRFTASGLLFELFRQSIATSTRQDANKTISLVPYFTSNGAARKEIQEKIADDFTNRIIAESGLSGVTWSVGRDDIRHQMHKFQRKPKDAEGYSRFVELEQEFHATRQQASDAQPGAPNELPVICPNCDDTLPHEHALYLHSRNSFVYCQGKCKECQASGSPCDLSRSTGPCTRCRSSGKTCHPSPMKGYGGLRSWQCGKCLWRYSPIVSITSHRPAKHIEEDCIGRCSRCEERDLPCRVFTSNGDQDPNPSGNTDCIFCLETREQCVRTQLKELGLAEGEMDD